MAMASKEMEKPRGSGALRVRAMAAALLKLTVWGVFLWWLALWFFRPTMQWSKFNTNVSNGLKSKLYGTSPGYLMLFDAPIFVVVVLGAIYLQIRPSEERKKIEKNKKRLRVSLWTYPVVVGGPLGLLTAADVLGLVLFVGMLTYILGMYLKVGFDGVGKPSMFGHMHMHGGAPEPHKVRWQMKLDSAGHKTGHLSMIAMAFIFFPVSRGSVLLRLVNIPFEHATKYHKWMASIMMIIVVAHGGIYLVLWQSLDRFWQEFWMWQRNGINNLAGVISGVAGILICLTSLPQVRNRLFELFFVTHHLYIAFIVFAAMHVGEKLFDVVMAGVFLFALDRFLRFLQSRKPVALISARNLPGNTVELVFAKRHGLRYTPASFILLRVPALSRWQWHPFTVCSSSQAHPSDSISVLVKACGSWTNNVRDLIQDAAEVQHSKLEAGSSCPFSLQANLEGPYGEQMSSFLRYDSLIMVAGGSGISPFLSVLAEMVSRSSSDDDGANVDVTLVWAVRKASELQVMEAALPPDFSKQLSISSALSLQVQAYVTREQAGDPEKGALDASDVGAVAMVVREHPSSSARLGLEAGKDSNWGHATVVMASALGYLAVWALLSKYYIEPIDHHSNKVYPSWADALLSMVAMMLGIVVFGGAAALLWGLVFQIGVQSGSSTNPVSSDSDSPPHELAKKAPPVAGNGLLLLNSHNIHYGCRPNLQEIFDAAASRLSGKHVGVFVCGPESLQADVAKQCKAHSSLLGNSVAVHFHSVSFDL